MEHTENYQLSQWAKEDRIQMQDFNSDNQKIDTALAGHAAALTQCGNCQIYVTSYVGTGEDGASHPNTLSFPQKPALVVVGFDNSFKLHIFPCDASIYWNQSPCEVRWNGNTLTWYSANPASQLNTKGKTYFVIAFWAKG